jgi:hypothetical protein
VVNVIVIGVDDLGVMVVMLVVVVVVMMMMVFPYLMMRL